VPRILFVSGEGHSNFWTELRIYVSATRDGFTAYRGGLCCMVKRANLVSFCFNNWPFQAWEGNDIYQAAQCVECCFRVLCRYDRQSYQSLARDSHSKILGCDNCKDMMGQMQSLVQRRPLPDLMMLCHTCLEGNGNCIGMMTNDITGLMCDLMP
jgi:hypothetical protein